MKWCCAIVCILTVMYCVCESDGLKILKKLKDILHPTEPITTTIVPTLPQYEKQSYFDREEDSKSWEQESSTSKTKPKHSEEDISTSHSSEKDGDSFSNSNSKYNIKNSNKVESHTGDSFKSNSFVTTTNNYDSAYGTDRESQFSSHGSFNNEGSKTTTIRYDQSNGDNYPGQSSFSDSFNNQKVKSTTPTSYDFNNQNKPEQSFEGLDNQRVQSTTPRNNHGSYNINEPDQSFNSVTVEEVPSTTPENSDSYQNKNHQTSTVNNFNYEESQSTTPINDVSSYDSNKLEQSSSSSFGSQNQNYDNSIFSNSNNNSSTTPRTDGSSYGFDNLNQPPPFDGLDGEKTVTRNRTYNIPEQSYSNDKFNNQVRTTTPTYEDTNYNEVQPGISSGNNNYEGSYYSTSTTSVAPDNLPESSQQGGYQHSYNSGRQPSSSTTKRPNQKKSDIDDGIIVFPDHPSLNPTPESERTYTKTDPNLKSSNGLHHATPAPVNDEEGRRIIDGPLKGCGPGEVFDTTKNACKELARK